MSAVEHSFQFSASTNVTEEQTINSRSVSRQNSAESIKKYGSQITVSESESGYPSDKVRKKTGFNQNS
jgi:hypothetical protein